MKLQFKTKQNSLYLYYMNNKIQFYFKQYIKSHKNFNIEFSEFVASKLGCTEIHAVQLIKTWKNSKQLINA